jgi:hypothetical protein
MSSEFKRCPLCEKSWTSREEFLGDRSVELVGYQPDFDELRSGALMFNHEVPGCGTTMEIEIDRFVDLYDGPIHDRSLFGTDECHGHCLKMASLERCSNPCENAWARGVAVAVKERMGHRAG